MAASEDPYRELAEQQFYADVAEGHAYRVRQPVDELGGRSLHEVWSAGDRVAVERWLADAYARTEATAERHRADPAFMAAIRERSAANHAERARAGEHRRTA